jgi:hypothetical protein
MRLAVRAGLGSALVALLAACSLPFGGPTPAQMLSRALD